MKRKTFSVITLGCKVNDYESTFTKELLARDFDYVDHREEKPDIIVIYSCVVTNTAESKTRKMINHAHKINEDALIIVCGCYVQLKGDELMNNNRIILAIGAYEKSQILAYIHQYFNDDEHRLINDVPTKPTYDEMFIDDYSTRTRAFLKIQDGCNQYCAFCAIPFARGKERSAKMANVLKEAMALSKNAKEIVLTGIHTGRYFDGENYLYDLLKELVKIESLKRIRLSSIEVTEITDDIIDLMANHPKIARNLHIPLQAGSDKILKLMNRPYTVDDYRMRIAYIRHKIPNISISTDLIVGFPNEFETEFALTLDLIKELKFAFIHTFPYSRKSGTVADKMSNHINGKIKKQRVHQVLALSETLRNEYDQSLVNSEVEVLFEHYDGQYTIGHTSEFVLLNVAGQYPLNEMYRCFVSEYRDGKLFGIIRGIDEIK